MKRRLKSLVENRKLAFALAAFSIFQIPLSAFSQSGGQFDLSHSVIAGGGGSNSNAGLLNVSGTAGQNIAGVSSGGGTFFVNGGFWFHNFVSTAAVASISGRVTTATGQGVRNVRLTLTAADGTIRRTNTSTFGQYAFDGVEVGQTYVLEIGSKRHSFSNPTRVFSLQEQITDMDFSADPL